MQDCDDSVSSATVVAISSSSFFLLEISVSRKIRWGERSAEMVISLVTEELAYKEWPNHIKIFRLFKATGLVLLKKGGPGPLTSESGQLCCRPLDSMILEFLLVLLSLAVKLGDEAVDGSVHVFAHIIGIQVAAADM